MSKLTLRWVVGSLTLSFVAAALTTTGISQCQAALISHWRLDDGAPSQTAYDSVGPNSGTLGGTVSVAADDPTWLGSGVVGTDALSFDGGDHVRIAHDSGQIEGNQMTISAWFKRGRNDAREMFFAKGNGSSDATTSFWLEFETDNDLTFYLSRDNGGTSTGSYLVGPNVTDQINWHNVVATFDGSTKRLYFDGALVGTQGFTASLLTDAPFDLAIGKLGSSTLNYQGDIDDVGLWGDDLTAGEAIALYNLAQQSELMYDLGTANELFELHNAGSGEQGIGGQRWAYTTGLTIGEGMVQKIDGRFFLQLDASGTGLQTIPIPEPATFWMLGLGLLALRRRARKTT